jgi:hypothetical protein
MAFQPVRLVDDPSRLEGWTQLAGSAVSLNRLDAYALTEDPPAGGTKPRLNWSIEDNFHQSLRIAYASLG